MKPTYVTAVRDAIRKRMSPPKRECVAEMARSTGITTQTLYNWRSQWQKQGQLVPAITKPPE
jgi:transposase-like protein